MPDKIENKQSLLFDGAARAALLRKDPFEVREVYEWADRVIALPALRELDDIRNRVIRLAPVIALIREDSGNRLAKDLADAKVSENRVRRFLESDRDDIDEQIKRMIRVMKGRAGVVSVLLTSLVWGEKMRRNVAQDYFDRPVKRQNDQGAEA